MTKPKWYTCTPISFSGSKATFCRDAGLFCSAFQTSGIESKLVLPLPHHENEVKGKLIRTEYINLESAAWWKSQNIDGVVLYAWSKSKYTPIAKAIHESGAKLVLYQDTGSSVYPWYDWWFNTKLQFRIAKFKHPFLHVPYALLSIVRYHSIVPLNYIFRRKHFEYADLICLPFPEAIKRYKKIPLLLSKKSRENTLLISCPVASHFRYPPEVTKQPKITAVGRWDDEEPKRPRFMLDAILETTQRSPEASFFIFGKTPNWMVQWHRSLPVEIQPRIRLMGVVPNPTLMEYYQKSQIVLCPSMHESTHIASAEGVCCGCSVVVSPNPSLSCIHWYASENSGTVSKTDTPNSFAEAIVNELELWEKGSRNPKTISNTWCSRLHATESVKRITNFFNNQT